MARAGGGQALKRIPLKEYSLAELLDDPLVGALMKSDGVNRRTLERLLDEIGDIHDPSGNRFDHGSDRAPDGESISARSAQNMPMA
jgi:hypothetical protein